MHRQMIDRIRGISQIRGWLSMQLAFMYKATTAHDQGNGCCLNWKPLVWYTPHHYCTLTCIAIHFHFPEPKPLRVGTQMNCQMTSPHRPWYTSHLAQYYTMYAYFINQPISICACLYFHAKFCNDKHNKDLAIGIANRLPQYISLAGWCRYHLPSCRITRVFVTSGKCGGILSWVIVFRWCYITQGYKKVGWKGGLWLLTDFDVPAPTWLDLVLSKT